MAKKAINGPRVRGGGILTPLESRRELRENEYARDFLEGLLKFRQLPIDKKIGVAPPRRG